MRALMIDNESLSLRPDGWILQVGYCVADLATQQFEVMPTAVRIRDADQISRVVSVETVRWWQKQNRDVAQSVFDTACATEVSADELFTRFAEIVGAQGDCRVWAKPSSFDLPMLAHLWGDRTPWKYYHQRCLMTAAASLDPDKTLRPPPNQFAHNAAADAEWQMRYLLALAKAYPKVGN